MSKLDQRGVVHLLVPLILLLGIIGGVYLITAGPLKLFPKASVSGPISGPITPVQLAVKQSTVTRNDSLSVSWSGIPNPHLGDFINIVTTPAGGGGTNHSYWIHNNCSWSRPDQGSPQPVGACLIPLDRESIEPGTYRLELFSGTTPSTQPLLRLAVSNNFTVQPSSPSCTLDQLRAIFGARRSDSNFNPACDINNDGRISATDYSALVSRPISGPIPPPPSPSPTPSPTPQVCTFNDLRAAFFTKRGDPKYNPACDLNNDGSISIFDFGLLRRSIR